MPLFSRKKAKPKDVAGVITELDEILGYLDEVYRKRLPLVYTHNRKTYETDILMMESKHKALRIQQGSSSRIPHDANVTVGFALDKTWWTFKSKFQLIDNKPYIAIPQVIKHNERRQAPRTAFSPREQVKVTVLSLSGGHGVFGMAKDISSDGMCMYIDKAMKVSGEKEIPPSPDIFKPGSKLEMVKLNRVPGCPLLEIQGVAKRVYQDGRKWCFAFQFAKLSKAHETMIAKFIEPRVLEFRYTKRSLKKRQEMDAERGVTPAGGSNTSIGGPTTSDAPAKKKKKAEPVEAPKIKLLVVGEELIEKLAFLGEDKTGLEVIPGLSPVTIIKVLTEDKPKAMICPVEFKGRSMLEVLEKVAAMGVGQDVRTVICSEEIQASDRIKFKMNQIEDVYDLPIEDPDAFIAGLKDT